MNKIIPLSVPNLKGKELEYVIQAVESEWVSTGGPFVNDFEKNVAEYVGVKGAVACQNGTSGLHTALLVCDITKDDEVIVPTLTFIAAVNPVKYLGAEPIFMDCDDSLTIDPDKLLEFCKDQCSLVNGKLLNKLTGKHIKAVVVVHVFGNMADMEKIMYVAETYNLKVIEDATEAIGTFYTEGLYINKYAGTIGNVGVYSFNGNKIITTGGGGMIVSNDLAVLKKAKHLTTQAKSDEVYYSHDEIGYKYRMTNLQAALGLAQLEQLEDFIKIKEANYFIYQEGLQTVPGLNLLDFKQNIRANYWFYALKCEAEYPLNRDGIIQNLASKGIQSRPIWGLISDQKPYLNCQAYRIEKARYYLERIVNIPCSTNLTNEDVLFVTVCLKGFAD